ncbi:hypothetical protein AUP68_07558 [Ilyonectria robusta]
MAPNQERVALILGSSGISGWGLLHECLSYPSTNTFSRVLGLSLRPITVEEARLPQDERLELHSGLDLTDKDQTLETLRAIPGIEHVTHIYYTAYAGHGGSPEKVVLTNTVMIDNALSAANTLCPKLDFFLLQTGGKGYGILGYGFPPAPWKEDLPRMPEPFASKIFNYKQFDKMVEHAGHGSWKWSESRASFLPGFVPRHNAMNIAQALGLYLSFYRSMNGAGVKCAFPGTQESWTAIHTDSSQDIVARLDIHISLSPEQSHGRSFNVGDGESVTWEAKWPVLCRYFGLDGVGPSMQNNGEPQGIEWLMSEKAKWPAWIRENGLVDNALEAMHWDILQTSLLTTVRIDFDLGASREIGFQETKGPGEGYILAFDRLRDAKFLP